MRYRRMLPAGLTAVVAAAVAIALWPLGKNDPGDAVGAGPSEKQVERERRMATILDYSRPYPERIRAVRELPLEVADEDLRALLAILEAPIPETNRSDTLTSLNEIIEQLRLKGRATEEYGKALARLMRAPEVDEVVRDYAVQHAVHWMLDCERIAIAPGNESAVLADRGLLLDALGAVLDARSVSEGSAWGTTLNALRDFKARSLHPEEIAPLLDENGELIRSVARGEREAHPGNRVAAIQTLPELSERQASLDLVRELAGNTSLEVGHRLPAIAVLGILGGDADLATLAALEQSDGRLRYAARAAADRLKTRLSTSSAR